MNKTFRVTIDDYSTFYKFAALRFRKVRPILGLKPGEFNIVVWLALVVIMYNVFSKSGLSLSSTHWPTALVVATPLALWVLGCIFVERLTVRMHYPKKDGLNIGQRTISLTEAGFSDSSDLYEGFFKWGAVDEVVNYRGNIYIFLDDMRAQIFPEACFSSYSEREELLTFLKDIVPGQSLEIVSENGGASILRISLIVVFSGITILSLIIMAIRGM